MAFHFGRCARVPAILGALAIGVLASASCTSAADIDVVLDQAKLFKLPERVATLVIGNPLIADASLQAGGQMVITGKGFGMTNVMALDRSGAILMNKSVEVFGPKDGLLFVYRGVERESYSCNPQCERRMTLGDSPAYFEATSNQAAARNGLAQGAAPSK